MIICVEERPSKHRNKIKRVKIMRCDNCCHVYEKGAGVLQCKHDFCSRRCFREGTKKGGLCYKAVQTGRIETFREKWGVDNVFANEYVKNCIREGNIKKWGVKNPMQTKKGKRLFRDAFRRKYGVENPMSVPEFREKMNRTTEERHGYIANFSDPRFRQHLRENINSKVGVSCAENLFHRWLVEQFKDVERHFKINGWEIDFFIPTLNTYVQFDGIYWHGLDRPIELIKEFKSKQDRIIYCTWLRDKEQVTWFEQQRLRLVRITDRQFEQNRSELRKEFK